jgi:hypothetical protein
VDDLGVATACLEEPMDYRGDVGRDVLGVSDVTAKVVDDTWELTRDTLGTGAP